MAGLILGVGSVLIFVVAVVLVCLATVTAFRCAGRTLNANRPARSRLMYGAAAAVSFFGIFLAAGAGFVGITTLLYHAAG